MGRGKNRAIEFFRFFFCCGIFFFHFGALHPPETSFWPFAGGYLGVEFFFLAAGWLMMPRLLCLPHGRAGLCPALRLFAGRVFRQIPNAPVLRCPAGAAEKSDEVFALLQLLLVKPENGTDLFQSQRQTVVRRQNHRTFPRRRIEIVSRRVLRCAGAEISRTVTVEPR